MGCAGDRVFCRLFCANFFSTDITAVRNVEKKLNQIILSLPWQTKIKLLASLNSRTLSPMRYKARLGYLYICSLFCKITCPAHGVKYKKPMWKYENLVCIYQQESKCIFIFSNTSPPKRHDDGKDHKFLSCFKKSSIKRFYFTSLHLQTLNTTLQIQQKPLLTSPPLVLHTVENSSLPQSCSLHIVFMYGY